ncbi:MAG: hypothetical protein HY905_00335 [Deltaproteobacteria bacterium]|nr:hypothetical protein [Deltaproteobacteria bacterium]
MNATLDKVLDAGGARIEDGFGPVHLEDVDAAEPTIDSTSIEDGGGLVHVVTVEAAEAMPALRLRGSERGDGKGVQRRRRRHRGRRRHRSCRERRRPG